MNTAFFRNIGRHIFALFGGSGTALAAGTGDNTAVIGPYLDRSDYLSAKLVITGEAVLADTKTLSITVAVNDATASAGTGAAVYATQYAKTVVATSAGGTTENFKVEIDVDLAGARQFIGATVTPDLSNTATDTCRWAAVWVFGPKKILS